MMKKDKIIIPLAILIAVLPHLGFPGGVRDLLVTVFAVAIIAVSMFLRKKTKHANNRSTQPDTFVEHNPEAAQHPSRTHEQPDLHEENSSLDTQQGAETPERQMQEKRSPSSRRKAY